MPSYIFSRILSVDFSLFEIWRWSLLKVFLKMIVWYSFYKGRAMPLISLLKILLKSRLTLLYSFASACFLIKLPCFRKYSFGRKVNKKSKSHMHKFHIRPKLSSLAIAYVINCFEFDNNITKIFVCGNQIHLSVNR